MDIDDYLKDDQGNFDFSDVGAAFRKMHHDALDKLAADESVIVVASFARIFEVNGYTRMQYDLLQVIDCHGTFKSVHDIPAHKLITRRKSWEPWV